jgi:hypothetical protein
MIRWLTVVVLCLGVSTLGIARLCPCDHDADAVAQTTGAAGDCPHSAPPAPADEPVPAGEHDCGHCEACLFAPALPLSPPFLESGAPVHADFPLRVLPPRLGAPNLPLRPPIA